MGGRWPTAGSRPCVRSRGVLEWLPPCTHAGPPKVGPSKLRTEISAGLWLDSDLPRKHAASLGSARVAGARHPLSGMSPQRDACLASASPLFSRTTTRLPEAEGSLPSVSNRLRCRRWGLTRCRCEPRLPIGSSHIPAAQSSHITDNSGPTLPKPQQSSEIWLLIGCLQPDNLVNLGSLVRTLK